ncbi:XRE family transcriptional regulator [Hymenobacter cheonanensis]|uniref:XRE family transcriptional regulator n=1 Tax=Hymenobacter sp. CA2-7 TaxID=3063993 RepID=UPI00271411C0|nr:helix-turn-helix domain-containing protein [Hymenobacter sp. CA2-7]MDO7887951.1 helix-turn-helix domain-containing protein [Hymenobacter sp. CA2-7]
MPVKQDFGDLLASLRESKQVSQQAIGELIGVSRSAVNGYEKGKSFPVPDKLVKLAQYFGVSVDYLLTGEKDSSQASLSEVSKNPGIHSASGDSKYPTGQTNVHAVGLLSDIPVIELRRVSFKARASFNYAQLQRFKDGDIFDTVLFRLPPGRTAEDYADALVFDIEGDSMEPNLRDGQQVIAWPVPDSKWEYLHNTICVVDYGEDVTVKAIRKNDLNNRDGLTLHATGGGGGEFTVERKDIHSIWEVREFYGVVPVRLLP